jgi:hypothetical protein
MVKMLLSYLGTHSSTNFDTLLSVKKLFLFLNWSSISTQLDFTIFTLGFGVKESLFDCGQPMLILLCLIMGRSPEVF